MKCQKCESENTIPYKNVAKKYLITQEDKNAIMSNQFKIIEYNPYEKYEYECMDCGFIAKEYSTSFPKDFQNILEYLDFLLANIGINEDQRDSITEILLEKFEGEQVLIQRPSKTIIETAKQRYIEIRPKCKNDSEAYNIIAGELECSKEYLKKKLKNIKVV